MENFPQIIKNKEADKEDDFDVNLEERKLNNFANSALADWDALDKLSTKIPQELQDQAMAAFGYADQILRNFRAAKMPDQRERWKAEYGLAFNRLQKAHERLLSSVKANK